MIRSSRRAFLRDLAASAGALAVVPNEPSVIARTAGSGPGQVSGSTQDRSFRGSKAGEQRVVEGLSVCWCPPGSFTMGSPATESGRRPDEAQVQVILTRGFWTATHEATQGQWRQLIGGFPDRRPSAEFGEGDDFPLYWVNFDEAETFCAELTRRARRAGAVPAGWEFSLPTEAQWEYACRAGTTTASSFGATLSRDQANIGVDTVDRTVRARGGARKVGSYPANPWGIHDMHGNVWEWCRDYYHARLPGVIDPDLSASKGAPNRDGTYSRVRRGGAWIEEPWACRSACRLRYESHRRSDHIGFRVFLVER